MVKVTVKMTTEVATHQVLVCMHQGRGHQGDKTIQERFVPAWASNCTFCPRRALRSFHLRAGLRVVLRRVLRVLRRVLRALRRLLRVLRRVRILNGQVFQFVSGIPCSSSTRMHSASQQCCASGLNPPIAKFSTQCGEPLGGDVGEQTDELEHTCVTVDVEEHPGLSLNIEDHPELIEFAFSLVRHFAASASKVKGEPEDEANEITVNDVEPITADDTGLHAMGSMQRTILADILKACNCMHRLDLALSADAMREWGT